MAIQAERDKELERRLFGISEEERRARQQQIVEHTAITPQHEPTAGPQRLVVSMGSRSTKQVEDEEDSNTFSAQLAPDQTLESVQQELWNYLETQWLHFSSNMGGNIPALHDVVKMRIEGNTLHVTMQDNLANPRLNAVLPRLRQGMFNNLIEQGFVQQPQNWHAIQRDLKQDIAQREGALRTQGIPQLTLAPTSQRREDDDAKNQTTGYRSKETERMSNPLRIEPYLL